MGWTRAHVRRRATERRGEGEEMGDELPQREERPKKGKEVHRDASGIPVEPVYAPRISAYKAPNSKATKRIRAQGQNRLEGISNPAKLKVMGGSVKGRRLESPDVYLRPMMGRVKEALFSTLTTFEVFRPGRSPRFLDLFAGSGGVGIEALSRGADHATFVDFAQDCCDTAERNVAICGFAPEQGRSVCADVLEVMRNPSRFQLDTGVPFDVVTATPPYQEIVYSELIDAIMHSPLVGEDTIVVIEYPVELGCLPHLLGEGRMVGLRNRKYGRTVVAVYIVRPSGSIDLADSRPEEFISLKKVKGGRPAQKGY